MNANQKTNSRASSSLSADVDLLRINEAISFHQQGKLELASTLYAQIISKEPRNSEALHLLGVIDYQNGKLQSAVNNIRKAIEINPNIASYYSNLGNALRDLKHLDLAVETYDKAISLKRDFAEAYSNRGIALKELKQFEAAIECFNKAIYYKPRYAVAYYNRGNAFLKLKQYKQADENFRIALSIDPNKIEFVIAYLSNSIHFELDEKILSVFEKYQDRLWREPDNKFNHNYIRSLFTTKTNLNPLKRRDRFRFLLSKLNETSNLSGFVAECGCYKGLSSNLMCKAIKSGNAYFMGEGFQIYDSFEGLSQLQPEDRESSTSSNKERPPKEIMKEGRFAVDIEKVKMSLSEFPNIQYFKGWIPHSFPSENPNQYRFVHVDVDLYQPTLDSLEYFWPKLLPGAIMLCDDFNWSGAEKAVKEFSAKHSASYNVSPFNQAYFVKENG